MKQYFTPILILLKYFSMLLHKKNSKFMVGNLDEIRYSKFLNMSKTVKIRKRLVKFFNIKYILLCFTWVEETRCFRRLPFDGTLLTILKTQYLKFQ